MPPTNDTGSPVTVGPDFEGNFFDVEPGEEYELPEPLASVDPEPEPEEAPEEDLGAGDPPPPPPPPPPGKAKAGDTPPPDDQSADDTSTKGTPA